MHGPMIYNGHNDLGILGQPSVVTIFKDGYEARVNAGIEFVEFPTTYVLRFDSVIVFGNDTECRSLFKTNNDMYQFGNFYDIITAIYNNRLYIWHYSSIDGYINVTILCLYSQEYEQNSMAKPVNCHPQVLLEQYIGISLDPTKIELPKNIFRDNYEILKIVRDHLVDLMITCYE